MQLPRIAAGKRFTLPPPARLGRRVAARASAPSARKAEAQATAIVTADPADAQRLVDELLFFAPTLRVALFPDWETLPYDTFSPHQDLIIERLATLWRLLQQRSSTWCWCRPPPRSPAGAAELSGRLHLPLQARQKLDEAALKAQLTLAGYSHVSQVVSPGEYAVRGGLIDLFPMGSPVPYRVDLFDDEIDSIRTFDPDTQRSLYPVPEVRLLPGREFPMDDAARAGFRSALARALEGDPTRSRIYKDIAQRRGHRRHRVLPAAVLRGDGHRVRLPRRATRRWCCTAISTARSQRFWHDTRERHRFLQHDPERPILPPEALFLRVEEFFSLTGPLRDAGAARRSGRRRLRTAVGHAAPDVSVERGSTEPLAALQRLIDAGPHARAAGRRERRPAREPARAAARPSHRRAQRRHAGRVRGQRRDGGIATAPLARGFVLAATRVRCRSTSSPRPSCSPPRRRCAGAASRSRSAMSRR